MEYDKSRGFALVEIIVAMLIFAITAIGTLDFYGWCVKRFIGNSRLSLEAVDFGRESMEGLYFRNSASLSDVAVTVPEPLPDSIPDEFPNELKDNYAGTREYTVTPKPASNYKVVETKVEWTP
ncbi:MAG: prepilin-type N-terminal cleavage/methylation domain-containing protein [Candidatus Omnitrophota bacterium]|nr:prepilin-type N-terminal cleavage/methylation domain-containing protein [Candidatus Omnitrophota bacterium]